MKMTKSPPDAFRLVRAISGKYPTSIARETARSISVPMGNLEIPIRPSEY